MAKPITAGDCVCMRKVLGNKYPCGVVSAVKLSRSGRINVDVQFPDGLASGWTPPELRAVGAKNATACARAGRLYRRLKPR